MGDSHEGRPRSDSSDVAFRKIFIGGLSYSTDEDKLKKYFKQYGSVQDAVVMKDPVSKRSRGFGFITFYDMSSVDNVLSNEPHTIDARKVEAKRAVPRSEMNKESSLSASSAAGTASGSAMTATPSGAWPTGAPLTTPTRSSGVTASSLPSSAGANSASGPSSKAPASTSSSPGSASQTYDSRGASDPRINLDEYSYNKVFVGGLHYDTRDAEFRSYFERYGKVMTAEVMFNRETHKSRGFGFIVFEQEEGAERVCAEKEHIISGKVVEVKRAIPRSKMHSMAGPSVPPSTPSKEAGGVTTHLSGGSPTGSTSAGVASSTIPIRNKRAMSTGSAQPIVSSPAPLSSSSSSSSHHHAPAATAPQKPVTSTPSSKKPGSSGTAGTPPVAPRGAPATSYAAALLLGSSHPPQMASLSQDSSALPPLRPELARSGSKEDSPSQAFSRVVLCDPSPMDELSLSKTSPSMGDVRNRAQSEPIGRMEGSSVLDGELVPFDLGSFQASRAGVIQPSSNNSSRSSSVAFPPSIPNVYSSNNLPWLSSPSTMPFESSDVPTPMGLLLPPAAHEASTAGKLSSASADALYGGGVAFGSQSLFYPQNMQFPNHRSASSELDDRAPSLFLSGGRNTGASSIIGTRMRASSLGALGSVPIPDNWAALMQSHISFQETMGIAQAQSPVAPQQRQQHQMFMDGGNSWNFGESTSLFGEASASPFHSNSLDQRDKGVSRVLGYGSSSSNSNTNNMSASGGGGVVGASSNSSPNQQHASNLSELRLESAEFDPKSAQSWQPPRLG